jgi:ribosomal protein L33
MAAKKKGNRIVVWLVNTETGTMNYVTTINKLKNPKIELKKYSPELRKHVIYKSKDRLK